MKPERWRQITEIFNAALVRKEDERAAFVAAQCGEDAALRREVEAMIVAHQNAGSFGDSPVYAQAPALEQAAKSIAARDQENSLAGRQLGQYQITGILGEGGMGVVYRARDTKLERTVALKLLPKEVVSDQERMRRFVREAKAAAALNHPNIATIYEISEAEGVSYIVMEHVEGETLAAKISRHPLDVAEILEIGSQVVDALEEAHSKGITHRDIKPANIMLTPRGQVKVLDFGLAKINRSAGPEVASNLSTLTQTSPGVVMGTVPYMSPEQALGRDVDHRSDLFSLGVVFYELATGRLPFVGNTTSETLDQILHAQPEAMSHFNDRVPAELERIVRKCLEKERERRYQSARELQAEISKMMGAARTTSGAEHLLSQLNRHKRGALAALAALVVAVAAVTYLVPTTQQRPQPDRSPRRKLWQLTSDAGLQSEPAWSPDGRFVAYSSDRGGNFDIWVQQVGEGKPVQITTSPAHDWQPDWSPDGSRVVFRSEREGGGLFVVPALGGNERKVSSFGYRPRWSPDGSQILFMSSVMRPITELPKLYVVGLDGRPPREVLAEFLTEFIRDLRVTWHPDGKRVSLWGDHRKVGYSFWTVPVAGGKPVRSELAPQVEQWLKEELSIAWCNCFTVGDFLWAPSGQAVYFDATSQGANNIWKVTVDPQTLRWVAGPERLTTSPGLEMDVALSRDGKRLAFTERIEHTRIWSVPFDAATGQTKGASQPLTAAATDAYFPALSRDGNKLVYRAQPADERRQELRVKSFPDSHETLLAAGNDFVLMFPRWSRDGTRLAYERYRPGTLEHGLTENSIIVLPAGGGEEQVLTSPRNSGDSPYDWSVDGEWVLASSDRISPNRWGLYLFPVAAAPRGETQMRLVTAHPDYNLWEGSFSPDGRWVSFNAIKAAAADVSTIYVVAATGGEWTRITEGKYWDDKPRWSPDGRTIYFVSARGGFFNVWGIRFDPTSGKPVGEAFRVTAFETPGQMVSPIMQLMEMSLAADRLVLPITEASGNIWILEEVSR